MQIFLTKGEKPITKLSWFTVTYFRSKKSRYVRSRELQWGGYFIIRLIYFLRSKQDRNCGFLKCVRPSGLPKALEQFRLRTNTSLVLIRTAIYGCARITD